VDAQTDTLPWANLRFSHTTAIRAALARAVSEGRYPLCQATANKHLGALRGTLKAAWRLGLMETDDYLRAVDLRPISGSRLPAGRNVAQYELGALLDHCRADDSAAGMRDAAVIGLAYLSGTRRGELVALHLADIEIGLAAIRVVGKGGKQRLVPLSPTVEPLLEAWMATRGDSPGPLFCPIDRTGNLRLGRMLTGEAIRQILARRTLAAGLAAISPHDLRRTYAGDLLDAGARSARRPTAHGPRLAVDYLALRPSRRQGPPVSRRAPQPRPRRAFGACERARFGSREPQRRRLSDTARSTRKHG